MFCFRHIDSHVRLLKQSVMGLNLNTCINANDYHVDLQLVY